MADSPRLILYFFEKREQKYNRLGDDELFQTFEEACQGGYKVSQDTESRTVYYKPMG